MKTISQMFRAGLGFILIGAFLTAMAAAQCGTPTAKLHKQAWRLVDPAALLTQAADTVDPIVGMWHVMFTAEGNSEGPPDGTPIDNALVVWHVVEVAPGIIAVVILQVAWSIVEGLRPGE